MATENRPNKGTQPMEPAISNSDKPLFFNYHEYNSPNFAPLPHYSNNSSNLIITHFPNAYTPQSTLRYSTTRVVRIPRVFDVSGVPQFSTVLPGREPGAINTDDDGTYRFTPAGVFEGQLHGTTSVSPLSDYVTDQEFASIAEHINAYLRDAMEFKWIHVVEFILDFMTFWLLSDIFTFSDKRTLASLETYVDTVNSRLLSARNVQLVPPRRSGYLSLDWEIPKPEIEKIQRSITEDTDYKTNTIKSEVGAW